MADARFFVLIRYYRADVFEYLLHGLFLYPLVNNGVRRHLSSCGRAVWKMTCLTHLEYEIFGMINPTRYWWTYGSYPKLYLSPSPLTKVNKGYLLFQIPGWYLPVNSSITIWHNYLKTK